VFVPVLVSVEGRGFYDLLSSNTPKTDHEKGGFRFFQVNLEREKEKKRGNKII
jgi:hypothetical protein